MEMEILKIVIGCNWRVNIALLWSDVIIDLNAASTICELHKDGQVIEKQFPSGSAVVKIKNKLIFNIFNIKFLEECLEHDKPSIIGS